MGIKKTAGVPLRVFVGGLPKRPTLDAQAVRAEFAKCGPISEFSLPVNSRKVPMGIAFITFAHRKGVESALKRTGEEVMGAKITVKIDQGREVRQPAVTAGSPKNGENGKDKTNKRKSQQNKNRKARKNLKPVTSKKGGSK